MAPRTDFRGRRGLGTSPVSRQIGPPFFTSPSGIEGATPSPDGHRIAYADGKTLVVVTAVGRHDRKPFPIAGVAGSNLTIRTIRWSRDGASLFYVRMLSGPVVPGPSAVSR